MVLVSPSCLGDGVKNDFCSVSVFSVLIFASYFLFLGFFRPLSPILVFFYFSPTQHMEAPPSYDDAIWHRQEQKVLFLSLLFSFSFSFFLFLQRSESKQSDHTQLHHVDDLRLYTSVSERRLYEELADFYALIRTVEQLEIAFGRGSVSADEYAATCSSLIAQYRASEAALKRSGRIESGEAFFRLHRISCPRALERLVLSGVPATVVYGGSSSEDRNNAALSAEAAQAFITLLDGLELGQQAVDDLQPLLSDVLNALSRIRHIDTTSHASFNKLREHWLATLASRSASEELSEEETRQLKLDVSEAYGAFFHLLKHGKLFLLLLD